MLASRSFGRLVVCMGAGLPLVRPVNYLFDRRSQSITFRTGEGSKLHALLSSTDAAFEIDGVDEGRRTGWSVIVHGVSEQITDFAEIRRLDRLGLEPWAPGLKRHWMRIRARTVSGRRIMLGDEAIPGHHLG